jgi:hypothetical protein
MARARLPAGDAPSVSQRLMLTVVFSAGALPGAATRFRDDGR